MQDRLWQAWITRAESNLARARLGKQSEEILYEDLCFDAQQAAEKALKGLLVSLGTEVPKTHSIGFLLREIETCGKITVPTDLLNASVLTDYAVTSRYPGDWEPVGKDEYDLAVGLPEKVVTWVRSTADKWHNEH